MLSPFGADNLIESESLGAKVYDTSQFLEEALLALAGE